MNAFWVLPENDRARLLALFPPVYPDVIAHHITLQAGVPEHFPLLLPVTAQIIGVVDDGAGVQALVVAIDGDVRRPDGSVFHITWSIDRARDRKPADSNSVLASCPWTVTPMVTICVTPEIS